MAVWDEQTGISAIDDPTGIRRKGLFAKLLNMGGDSGDTSGAPMPMSVGGEAGDTSGGDTLVNRIKDDNQTGNRSGGPAGGYQRPPYQDPGKQHLADLVQQQAELNKPQPKPSFGKRLLQSVMDAAPTIGAYASGSSGGPMGADQAMQTGVARRRQQEDVRQQDLRQRKATLAQEIEKERGAQEQGERQWGIETERERMQQEGMTSREKIAAGAQVAAAQRLADTIKAQGDRQKAGFEHADDSQQAKFEHDEEMEDQKQVGRMALQQARARANKAIVNMRQTMRNIPPPVGKAFDSFEDSQSRMDVMQDAYDKALRDHDQQAMLNLLANHLGMTMGLQKGARMTRDIINEAQKSGYLDERIEAHFDQNGYMTGVVLTPRQMNQMVDLAKVRLTEDARKVTEMETYFNVRGGMAATPRVPGASTAGAPGGAGGTGGGSGAASSGSPGQLKPPSDAPKGYKWQHRLNKGKVEWRMVPEQQ